MIKFFGQEKFDSTHDYDELRDYPIPPCFNYITSVFFDLYYTVEDVISYQDMYAYCKIQQVVLSLYEVQLIRKMNSWASQIKSEMRREEETNNTE